MAASKSASRRARRAFRQKHPRFAHNFSGWEYGEVVCRHCGMDAIHYEARRKRKKPVRGCCRPPVALEPC